MSASPLRTWTSVFLVLAICWYLFFNGTQLYNGSRALMHPMASEPLEARKLQYSELNPGMIGQGLLVLFVILGTIFVMTHRHERPDLLKSQKRSYFGIWILLLLTITTQLMMYFLNQNQIMKSETIIILSLTMDSLRILFLGGIIGMGVHLFLNH